MSENAGIIAPAAGEILKECQLCDRAPPVPLSLCGACRVVYYCCRDHQVEDRPTHKDVCKEVGAAKAAVDKTKGVIFANAALGASKPGGGLGVSAATGRAQYNDYVGALSDYGQALIKAGTQEALVEALLTYKQMLDLRRNDPRSLNAHKIIPGLFIRLDRDQEAYDACLWIQQNDGNLNNWQTDKSVPILDLDDQYPVDADPLEVFDKENIENTSYVILILMRMHLGFKAALRAKSGNPTLTDMEVFETAHETEAMDIVARHPELLTDNAAKALFLQRTVAGAMGLAAAINEYNPFYWGKLGNFDLYEDQRIEPGSVFPPGTLSEAEQAISFTHSVWEANSGIYKILADSIRSMPRQPNTGKYLK